MIPLALKKFAKNLEPLIAGIPYLTEGVNNKIKVIKRMAYGFRDDAYFLLKIRVAFPEFGEEPKKAPTGKWALS